MKPTILARWESPRGANWVELNSNLVYSTSRPTPVGTFRGILPPYDKAEAISILQARIDEGWFGEEKFKRVI